MTSVSAYSYTHSVTFVADNMLRSLKEIIRLSGLNPVKFADDWAVNLRGIETWMRSGHLTCVILEIYDPQTNKLIKRWDIDVVYEWGSGDGSFYADVEAIRYALKKAGVAPSTAKYDLLVRTKPGRPTVDGWGPASSRSTAGMVRQSLGDTIGHNGLGAATSFWRQA
jgi:hypothetical protein